MAGNGRGKYLSLGDLKISGYCVSGKKMQRPVGRRWLTAMINVVEMEITDWRKKLSDQGRQHRGWSFVIYKAQYSINICWMASSSLRITNEKEIYYLEISLRGISKHFTPLPHAKTFKVGGELSGGAFLSRTTVFWGPPHTHTDRK